MYPCVCVCDCVCVCVTCVHAYISAITHVIKTDLETFLKRLNAVLLAGEVGTGVPVLWGQEQHLRVALFPHLGECLQGEVTVTHSLLHHLHFILQQQLGLDNNSTNYNCYYYNNNSYNGY